MHPILSVAVTADYESIMLAIDLQSKMLYNLTLESDAKKYANTAMLRRRAELKQRLYPEEREGKGPALSHLQSGATVGIPMECARSSVVYMPYLYKECCAVLQSHVSK